MPKGMQPIYKAVVGSGGATSVLFNNIPQTYSDLLITISARTNMASNWDDIFGQINEGTPAVYSTTVMYGIITGVTAARGAAGTTTWCGWATGSTATANAFSSNQIYIPNYASDLQKRILMESATEGQSTSQVMGFASTAINSTHAVKSIRFSSSNGMTFQQYTSFNLYGIAK